MLTTLVVISQTMETNHDLEANRNRISETPTIVNSVKYTNSIKHNSDVPQVPAVPDAYTRQNSVTDSIKTDKTRSRLL